jgi:RNA polymerase sigma-70 factor (ECF subfamily)
MMPTQTGTYGRPDPKPGFVQLVAAVEGELRGFIRKRVGARGGAEDLLQQTFLHAWRDPRFDPCHSFARAWLYRTASRLVLDWVESAESHSVSLDDLSAGTRGDGSRGSRADQVVDRKARDPLEVLIEEERHDRLKSALESLTAERREVLERYYLWREGNQFEIAAAMGLTVAAFNSRLNRARRELKKEIFLLRGRDGSTGSGHEPSGE